jgi:hypothetical protein
MAFKSIASQLPSLIQEVESALTTVLSAPSQHAALETRSERLFELANMQMMAQPGITDGSPLACCAEAVASTTRLLVRVNLRELLKAAKNGDSGKVRSLAEKANTLLGKLSQQVADLQSA